MILGHSLDFDEVDLVVDQSLDVCHERLEYSLHIIPTDVLAIDAELLLGVHNNLPFHIPAVGLDVVHFVILKLGHREVDVVFVVDISSESGLNGPVEL